MTAKQLQLLRYICGYQEAHDGVSPSVTEMQIALKRKGRGKVYENLVALEYAGMIHRPYNRHQWIEVLRPVPVPRAPDGAPLYIVPGIG